MTIKVCKFGGTSLANANQIKKVKRIINSDNSRKYIIPSAPGKRGDDDVKVTDLLLMCKDLASKNDRFDYVLQNIKDRFIEIITDLELDLDMEDEFMEIKFNLLQGASNDYIVSRGEFLNGKLLAAYLGFNFIDPVDFIIFDEQGNFMQEFTHKLLSEKLESVDNAVIPGFYGGTKNGIVKIFSRGGSDITGAVVARACDADVYENWTDVSGLLVTDPRIVKNPKPIKSISYSELRELSSMGASVLHEDAVYPAKIASIPIEIKNTNRPQDFGTVIAEKALGDDRFMITGIAGKKDYKMLKVTKNSIKNDSKLVERLLCLLEEHCWKFEHIPSTVDSLSFVAKGSGVINSIEDLIDDISKKISPDEILVEENIALIGVVGTDLSSKPEVFAILFNVLATLGVDVKMIDLGSNDMNIIVGIDNDDYEYAIKGIYNAYNKRLEAM